MSRLTTAAAVATVALAAAGVAFLALRAEAAPPPSDAAAPLVLYGEEGDMPIYVEDPVGECGLPVPVGPQHLPNAVRLKVTQTCNQPPVPVVESHIVYDSAGNAFAVDHHEEF